MSITLEITGRAKALAIGGLVLAALCLSPYSAHADEIPIPECGPGEEAQPTEGGYVCGPADLPCPEFEDYYLEHGLCPGDEPPAPPTRHPVTTPRPLPYCPPVTRGPVVTPPTTSRVPVAVVPALKTPEVHPVTSGPTTRKIGLASVVSWKIGL